MATSIRLLALLGLSWSAASASLAASQAGALEIGDPYFPGLGNGGYDVEHYALELALDMDTNEIAATARLRARALHGLASFSLDLHGLVVERVGVDGREARFERPAPAEGAGAKPAELVIHPAAPLAAGAPFTVEVAYGGSPAGRPDPAFAFLPNSPGSGWRRLGSGVYVTSQCIGASSWFPCNDHPRDKATYSFRVTVARPWTAAANGVLTEVLEADGARTFVFEARDPMASYLATLNVAEFEVLELSGPRGIPMRIHHPPDASAKDLAAFRRQGEVLEFLEAVLGPYPFEAAGAVIQSEPAAGALECQTLPVYGRGANVELVLHELAHQWFGNSVSPDLWRDLWLSEALASYMEWLWLEDQHGVEAYDQKVRRTYAALRQRKTSSPFDPGVDRAFGAPVYERGPFVVHGLRREVGDEVFFRILREWLEANANGHGSTASFLAHAAKCAGRDLAPFFDAWLFAEVTPEVPELEGGG